jgi:signal peptidase I
LPNQSYDLPTGEEPASPDNSGYNLPNQEEQPPQSTEEKSPLRKFLTATGRFFYEVFKTTAIIVIVAFLIRFFLIQPFLVEGESMEPNFHNNEYLIIQKISGYFDNYQRGDVIVFKYPNNPEISYIKRIIGLPNEKIKFDRGKVSIYNSQYSQGKELSEDYLLSKIDETNQILEKNLGQDEYFVMGDNRNNSSDSREWGILNKKYIQGKVLIRLYPFSDIGLIHSPQFSF